MFSEYSQYRVMLCADAMKLSIPRLISWPYFQDQFNTQVAAAAKISSKVQSPKSPALNHPLLTTQMAKEAGQKWFARTTPRRSPQGNSLESRRLQGLEHSTDRSGVVRGSQVGGCTSLTSGLLNHPDTKDGGKTNLEAGPDVENVHRRIEDLYVSSQAAFRSLDFQRTGYIDMVASGSCFNTALNSMGLSRLSSAVVSVAEKNPEITEEEFLKVFMSWAGTDMSSLTGFPPDKVFSRGSDTSGMHVYTYRSLRLCPAPGH